MTSLVDEIQQQAIDERVPVSALLRKVKLAAFKLGLNEVESWVSAELDGYSADAPSYRIMQGTVRYNNGYTGWQPLLGDTSQVSKKSNGQSISQIEALLNSSDSSDLVFMFHSEANAIINKLCGDKNNAVYCLVIDKAQLAGVLSAVRGKVLDWAINLERIGIKGDGMAFSKEEKRAVEGAVTTFNIDTISAINGNLGVGNTIGSMVISGVSVDATRAIVPQLRANADALAAVAKDPSLFLDRLDKLEAQLADAKPDPSLLASALQDIRAALSGAAGNMVATGALTLLNGLLGTGVPTV